MKTICDACQSPDIYSFYKLDRIPVFLNKLYPDKTRALASPAAKVNLTCCARCSLVFNAEFQDALMDYDDDYIQSQGHSASFHAYTRDIAKLITGDIDVKKDRVVEIGCGKEAYFLNMLLEQGIDIVGFDPVYEGKNPRITKKYFDRDSAGNIRATIAIMRLTFYLLDQPLDFLRLLKETMSEDAAVYIEVPRFEWILEKNAFWDISHEVNSYFTEDFFQTIFSNKAVIYRAFSDQYMVVKAYLRDLILEFPAVAHTEKYQDCFKTSIPVYRVALEKYKNNYVWGAGAKGNAFANILDPDAKYIRAVIDINREKQGHFVPLSGHPCVAPASIPWRELGPDSCLWIMNENYKAEIVASIPDYTNGNVVTLGENFKAPSGSLN